MTLRRYRSLASAQAIAVLALTLTLAACSSDKDPNAGYVERPLYDLYTAGMDQLAAGDYKNAAAAFDEVDRQHPYSKWATKAELMSAYAHFQEEKYDDAINGLDGFIQLHPGNPDTPYAYYLKALCYYSQIADVRRDQGMTYSAMQALQEVITRFPATKYARDARLKLDLTRDHLAGKEMDVGRYYFSQKQYLAAVNRYKVVVDQFQTTTQVPEALYRLVETYTVLGLKEEAKKSAAVLGANYPGTQWYADAYAVVAQDETNPNAVDESGTPGAVQSKGWWARLINIF